MWPKSKFVKITFKTTMTPVGTSKTNFEITENCAGIFDYTNHIFRSAKIVSTKKQLSIECGS